MAESSTTGNDSITFTVKSSNDTKYPFTLPASTSIRELKEKLSTPEQADTPPERQRLIYSGRVLKDTDTLATYNVKDGHTVHLVKSAAPRPAPAATPPSSTTPNPSSTRSAGIQGVPTNLAAGTGNDPLAGLTGARYAGYGGLPSMGMFGPDGGMGPPPDPEQIMQMLDNPQVQGMMNEALQNPQVIDMLIQQNPVLREMGPMARQMLMSPGFRQTMTDPNSLRQLTQMQRAMGLGMGGPAGGSSFPAPGVTNTTPGAASDQTSANSTQNQSQAPPAANPFAALFGNPMAHPTGTNTTGSTPNTTQNPNANPANPPNAFANPFLSLFNPGLGGVAGNPYSPENAAALQTEMQNLFRNNPFLSDLAGGVGQAPDTRPPEDRYAEQLRQLNDMGFFDFDRNIEALRRTGGSVQGAVEYLLNLS